jgi:hypothetical protein
LPAEVAPVPIALLVCSQASATWIPYVGAVLAYVAAAPSALLPNGWIYQAEEHLIGRNIERRMLPLRLPQATKA